MSEPSKASKRRGKRPGAGRKPKGYRSTTALTDLDLKSAEAAELSTPAEIESAVRAHARSSIESLKNVMLHSDSEAARIAAAKALLDRAFGKPAVATGINMALPLFDQASVKSAPGQVIEDARKLAPLAITVLHKIAEGSARDSARVSASRALLDRGIGAVAVARLEAYRDDLNAIGKKEQANHAATAAACGKFTVPPAPKGLGKKEAALLAAQTAGEGTSWEDLLIPTFRNGRVTTGSSPQCAGSR